MIIENKDRTFIVNNDSREGSNFNLTEEQHFLFNDFFFEKSTLEKISFP